MNGFAEAFERALRRCIGGGWRRLRDTSATALSDTAKTRERLPSVATLRVSPEGAWWGAVPPLTPATATTRREHRTRRLGEGPRQRRGACRVARQGALQVTRLAECYGTLAATLC